MVARYRTSKTVNVATVLHQDTVGANPRSRIVDHLAQYVHADNRLSGSPRNTPTLAPHLACLRHPRPLHTNNPGATGAALARPSDERPQATQHPSARSSPYTPPTTEAASEPNHRQTLSTRNTCPVKISYLAEFASTESPCRSTRPWPPQASRVALRGGRDCASTALEMSGSVLCCLLRNQTWHQFWHQPQLTSHDLRAP